MNNQINNLLNNIETELKLIKKEKNAWTTSEYSVMDFVWDVVLNMIEESFDINAEKCRNIL